MKRVPAWLSILGCIAVLALVGGALSVIPAGKVAISPHAPINLDHRIRIAGEPAEPIHGRLALVAVEERSVSVLQSWLLHFDHRVTQEVEVDAGGNPSSSANTAEDQSELVQSKQIAAEVAFAMAGRPAKLSGDGAIVTAIDPDSPAAKVLKVNDTILGINGHRVQTARDVTNVSGHLAIGSIVKLDLRRGQQPLIATLKTIAPAPGDTLHRSRIGIGIDSANLKITLPQPVTISTGDVGGPSAGLAFALALYDDITGRDIIGGRFVVATGELGTSLDGEIEPIGGVRQKAIAAQDAGYDLMLVPSDNEADAVSAVNQFCSKSSSRPCLHVIGVTSVQQAVQYLSEDPSQLTSLYGR